MIPEKMKEQEQLRILYNRALMDIIYEKMRNKILDEHSSDIDTMLKNFNPNPNTENSEEDKSEKKKEAPLDINSLLGGYK